MAINEIQGGAGLQAFREKLPRLSLVINETTIVIIAIYKSPRGDVAGANYEFGKLTIFRSDEITK